MGNFLTEDLLAFVCTLCVDVGKLFYLDFNTSVIHTTTYAFIISTFKLTTCFDTVVSYIITVMLYCWLRHTFFLILHYE